MEIVEMIKSRRVFALLDIVHEFNGELSRIKLRSISDAFNLNATTTYLLSSYVHSIIIEDYSSASLLKEEIKNFM